MLRCPLIVTGAFLSVASPVSAQTATEAREEIVVVGTTPLPGSDTDRDKIPSTVQILSSDAFAKAHAITILDTLSRRIPGLELSDSQGNGTFQDLHYRGFVASPLQGKPQGIAVYQDGVRLNEAFGDTVNWELIPEVAIDRVSISAGDPAFGLNALGGAINMGMKNGFTFHRFEGEVEGGSYGRFTGSIAYGVKFGDYSFYAAGEAFRDDGYRLLSNSDIERIYADAGYSGDISEFHLIVQAARSKLGVVGPTPLDLIKINANAIYTSPQTTSDQTATLALNGTVNFTNDLAIQANIYGRYLGQKHVDGNGGDFESCSAQSSFGGDLCLENRAFDASPGGNTTAFRNQFVILGRQGQTFAFVPGTPYGTLDRVSIGTKTFGAAIQATYDASVIGHDNNFAFGASIDRSDISFTANSALGFVNPDLSVGLNAAIPGSGSVVHTLGDLGYAPVGLGAATRYYGIYAADTFDITPRLSLTAGIRVNIIDIDTADIAGTAPELNARNDFTHGNPEAGLTYKLGGGVTAYGGYSQSNRAPTPLELDCADPARPCLLENSLVSDPPLRQVVANSYEAGLRGSNAIRWSGGAAGRLVWNIGLYRTDSEDDIVSLASAIQGRGYYANVPSTRRQGLELNAKYTLGPWEAFANYSFVDATYRFSGLLASPNNPSADDNGTVAVRSGNRIPGVPRHQLKAGLDYAVTSRWSIGGDAAYVGSQYLIGDDSNRNAKLTPYWTANIRTSYQLTPSVQISGRINNLFDRRYASYGAYFDAAGVAKACACIPADPRTLSLAQPLSAYAAVKLNF